nr:RNA-directed DNA polymerase, eukaryota [Tanacetum cinerariifolium]
MVSIDLFSIKALWGYWNFDFAFSPLVGSSCGIVCVWDQSKSIKEHVSKTSYFDALMGTCYPTSTKLLVIFFYAPQESFEKQDLCNYLRTLIDRCNLMKELQELSSLEASDTSQKAKIRWPIEGDENKKYFHGVLNKKRSQLAIRGTLANGDWISNTDRVKFEFDSHFKKQFFSHQTPRIEFRFSFPNRLSSDQIEDLECNLTYEEVKKAAVSEFFVSGHVPKGCGRLLQPPSTKIKCAQIESRANKRLIINLIGHNAEIRESKMIGLEMEQETTKVVVIKERLKEAKDRQERVKLITHNTFAKIVSPRGSLSEVKDEEDSSFPYKKELKAWSPNFTNYFSDNYSAGDLSEDEDIEKVNGKKGNTCEEDKETEVDHVSECSCMNVNGDAFENNSTVDVKETVGETNGDSINQPNEDLQTNLKGVSSTKGGSNRILKIKTGGSILEVMESLVEIGETMGYNMKGCANNIEAIIAKKSWIREINRKHKVSFVAIQETKMKDIGLFSIKALWGNFSYDFAISPSFESSGGGSILEVMESLVEIGETMGYNMKGCANNIEAIIGVQGEFQHKVSFAAIQETKMKDIGLFSIKALWGNFSYDFAISPSFESSGVEDSWSNLPFEETNNISLLKKKFQALKASIKSWCKEEKQQSTEARSSILCRLVKLDKLFDHGKGNDDLVNERTAL